MTQQGATESDQPVRVLLVCSANRCRSPLAGAMLARQLAIRDVAAEVTTAGFGSVGQPATRLTSAVAAGRDLDLQAHRSQTLGAELAQADLVLGMERLHVRDLVVKDPTVWPRAFTLKELVRRGEAVGPRRADETLHDWLRRAQAGRGTADLLGASADDDIADPSGGTIAEHEDTATELADLVARLVEVAWPAQGRVSWMAP